MRSRWYILLVGALPAVALGVPVGGASRPFADGPGDQHHASLDAGQVAFESLETSGPRVLLGDAATGALRTVAEGAGEPDLARNVLAYRTPGGIALRFALTGAVLREPAEPGAGAPAASPTAAAWEVGAAGDRDIGWYQPLSGLAGVLALPGDQRAPALSGNVLALVDEAAGGAVLLHDLVRRDTRVACPGGATGVAVDGAGDALRVAVARAEAGADADIEIWDGAGARLAALDAAGEQRNPRLAGSWVAFEDLSAGRAVVVLWNWETGLAHVPRASRAPQAVGDLAEAAGALTLALSESNGTDLDLVLYTLPLPAVDDGTGSDWPPRIPPARCDDAGALELASLVLARDVAAPQAGEVAFTMGDGLDLGVLLCIDATGPADAEVALDGVVLAAPDDFTQPAAHLERRAVALGGEGLVSARLAGAGSELRVRVLADPAGTPAATAPGGAGGAGGVRGGGPPGAAPVPAAPPATARAADGAGGCGAGPGGPLALLGLWVAFAARRRTRVW